MEVIKPPAEYSGNNLSLFLAGGISGCPDWQEEMIRNLAQSEITFLNPRRDNFQMNPMVEQTQIEWEFRHLRKATAISFWFPKETLCPITLYELGAWSMTEKKLFIGIDAEYKRRSDIIIQTSLVRPEVKVVSTLSRLAAQIESWISNPF